MAIGIEMMRSSTYNLSYMFDHIDDYGPQILYAADVSIYDE